MSWKQYPNVLNVVHQPALPYWGPIPGGLHQGKIIVIKGHVPHGAYRFDINLTNGQFLGSGQGTIGFHFNPRFDQHHVVRNSCIDGTWGPEEKHGHFPFHTGKDFEVMILTEESHYKVAVDGRHYIDFHHRFPYRDLNAINLEGSVQINKVEFRDQGYPGSFIQPAVCPPGPPSVTVVGPAVCPPGPPPVTIVGPAVCPPVDPGFGVYQPPPMPVSTLPPMYNPPIPFTYPMYGGVKAGMMIYISGHPSASPYRFNINLQCGVVGGAFSQPDIAFHFNPRFDEAAVIRNTRIGGSWEQEERHAQCFPFMPGMNFDMIIRVEVTRFMVAVNGQHFIEYRHRVQPLSRVDTVVVEGDVSLASVRFG